MNEVIKVRGARQHNLKNVSLDIPKFKLVVFTGVSGSGKSSFAYDTIYAEGQRRYVESLSTYARQFLGIMEKPDVDLIEGLSPAISIDQKTTSRNPRSTVGTVTEIYDYLRLLFARIGHPHCPVCGAEIASQSLDQIVEGAINLINQILQGDKIVRFVVHAPVVRDKKGEYSGLFSNLKAKGYKQVRIDGVTKSLSDEFVLIKTNKHTIDAVIDKITVEKKALKDKVYKENLQSRLNDSMGQALGLSDGLVSVSFVLDKTFEMPEYPKEFEDHLFSENFSCPIDNISIPEIEPRTFSFNSPHGACPTCNGLGLIKKVAERLVFSKEISITEGAILPFKNIFENDTWYSRLISTVCAEHEIDTRTPLKDIAEDKIKTLLRGTGEREYKVTGTNRFGKVTYIYEKFYGIEHELEQKFASSESEWVRSELQKYLKDATCPDCKGTRLKKEALSVTIDNLNISDITSLSINELHSFVVKIEDSGVMSERESSVAKLILNELKARIDFLLSVGLDYISLSRSSSTLSGGEAQRIRLASQIGSGLSGVLYVLDEPTIGLHAKDNQKLINTLMRLRDIGNSVLVVEHDHDMIIQSDHIIDFGPMAGKNGGSVVAQGSAKDIISSKLSVTGKYLSGKRKINIPPFTHEYVVKKNEHLAIYGASENNLKNINVSVPLRKLVVITGVSGSGKSTLLVDTIYPAIKREKNSYYRGSVGKYKRLEGVENIDKVLTIDQSPIGRTPRSNPATYTKVFDDIREVFAKTRDSKVQGYKKGRFSFNVKGGRCESCEGQGKNKIEMQFMSDLWIQCEVCDGKRYNKSTLEINYKGKNISQVLEMTVEEALEFFHTNPKIIKKLETLSDVGLNYIELGQPAPELSGGEAQRIKLASELSKRDTGNTLYILDEPTTGLHFADLEKLLQVLRILVAKGNSVILIEHNMDVVKNADWIIDLGPDGGDKGGYVVAEGEVGTITRQKRSHTGAYLKKHIL